MVNSDFYIKKIISINTLLSFNGIIPSFSAFQQKMVRLIRQLQICLHKECVADADVQRLCWLITLWLDKHTETRLDRKFFSWGDYSLEHALYGHKSDEDCFAVVFTEMLENACQPAKRYACRIALLYSTLAPQDKALIAALANVPAHLAPDSGPVKSTPVLPHSIIEPSEPLSALPVSAPLRHRIALPEGAGLLAALIMLWILSIFYLGSLL